MWLSAARDITQVVFYCVVTVVTILTFLRARKTLLQPLRTEVFKAQLGIFSELLRLLGGKTDGELKEEFGVTALVAANATYYLHKYAQIVFDEEIDAKTTLYSFERCPQSIFIAEPDGRVDSLIRADHATPELLQRLAHERAASDKMVRWAAEAKVREIRLPRKYVEAVDQFQKLMSSPLLPKPVLELCDSFIKAVEQNTFVLQKVLSECCLEMRNKYKTVEELYATGYAWIQIKFIDESVRRSCLGSRVAGLGGGFWRLVEQEPV